MKVKYVGLFLLLVFIFTIFLTFNASSAVYQITIPCSYDGYITGYLSTGIYTRTDDADINIVHHQGHNNWEKFIKTTFMEWNISVIPSAAVILNMGITFKGAGSSVSFTNCETTYFYNLTVVPSQEDDNTPGNQNIYNSRHTDIAFFRGECNVCGGVCPCPTTIINTYNTTMGGDYWFANFQTNLQATNGLQEVLPIGYYSILFKQDFNPTQTTTHSNYYSDDSGVFTPELWVEYEVTIPKSNYSYPADFDTDVGWDATGINLSMNISHDNNDLMNMTWWAYNESSETFVQIGSNLSVPPGNYNQTWYNTNYTVFSDGFETCHTYYWKVEANDSRGNETIFYREFTTYCVDPPTNFFSYSVDNSTLNLTWTKMQNYTGGTNTTIYYVVNGNPPAWGSGIFLCNTSEEYFVASLSEATCYGFSAWSIHQTADGDWYRSLNRALRVDCTEGGNFTIQFKDEDTHEFLNFTRYPWNLTTFQLRIHYENDYNDYDITETFMGYSKAYFLNTSEDFIYMELFIHYDFDDVNIPNGLCGYAQYVRKLLPSAAIGNVFTFYVANYTVYNEYFYCMNVTGTLEQYLDATFQDSVVKYIWEFEDRTHIYDSALENDVYLEIYAFNDSTKYVIHSELWDATDKIYPHLIYEKGYLCRVGLVSDTDQYTHMGLAPTHQTIAERLIIPAIDENATYIFDNVITLTAGWTGNSIYVTYADALFETESLTCTINEYLTGAEVYTSTVSGFSEYTFTTPALDPDTTYTVTLTVVHPSLQSLYGDDVVLEFPVLPGIDEITSAAKYNNLITVILGLAPFYNPTTMEQMNWVEMMMFFVIIGIFCMLLRLHAPLAFFVTGGFSIAFYTFVSGLSIAFVTVGILMLFIGFLYFLSGYSRGG